METTFHQGLMLRLSQSSYKSSCVAVHGVMKCIACRLLYCVQASLQVRVLVQLHCKYSWFDAC